MTTIRKINIGDLDSNKFTSESLQLLEEIKSAVIDILTIVKNLSNNSDTIVKKVNENYDERSDLNGIIQ